MGEITARLRRRNGTASEWAGGQTISDTLPNFDTITAVGRHADLGKLVFTGAYAGDGNRKNSIGVLERATGDMDITTYKNALDALDGYGGGVMDTRGIDCDRSTGRYVVVLNYNTPAPGFEFNPWWSDDLITWTEGTVDVASSTDLRACLALWYDDNLQMWVMFNSHAVLLSLDGKSWINQFVISDSLSPQVFPEFTEWGSALPSWGTPNKDRIMFGARDTDIWMISPTPGVLPAATNTGSPETSDSVLLNGYFETIGGGLRTEVFNLRIRSNVSSISYWDGWIYICTAEAEISRSQTADFKDHLWDEFTLTIPDGPPVLSFDSTWKSFNCIEGVFWIRRSTDFDRDTWWRYDDAPGVPPDGDLWVSDNTGPRGFTRQVEDTGGGLFSQCFNWPDEGWAFVDNDAGSGGTGEYWIAYNSSPGAPAAIGPVLAAGEIGLETDTGWQKIGDGITEWNDLSYWHGPPWLQGISAGGPASTFPGRPTDPFVGVMCSAYIPVVYDAISSYTGWAALGRIDGAGYDGDDIILFGVLSAFVYSLYYTDSVLSAPTQAFDLTTLTGYVDGYIHQIEYSAELGIWVMAIQATVTPDSMWSCSGDPTVVGNWTEAPEPGEWAGSGFKNIVRLFWDTGLQLFFIMTRTNIGRMEAQVSNDGINWQAWDDYQAVGGVEPDDCFGFIHCQLNGDSFHMIAQEEEYVYKTGDDDAGTFPGAASGFTKTDNNGVLGGSGVRILHHIATDGTAIVVSSNDAFNASLDPTDHPGGFFPNSWGPDGRPNTGWNDTDMGFSVTNGLRTQLLYVSKLARPWVIFAQGPGGPDTDYGWFDSDDIVAAADPGPANAPSWARCTVEPFAAMDALYTASLWNFPVLNGTQGTHNSQYQMRYDADSVYGLDGYLLVVSGSGESTRANDYLVFQKPSG
jgi:hypothetical protein